MSQNSLVISDGSGAAVLTAINNAVNSLVTQNSGAGSPATTYAYQMWADTTTGLLKQRNAANTAWVTVGPMADLGIQSSAQILAAAAGTADALTAIYTPAVPALTNGLTLKVRPGFTNATPTPTFSPNGLTAKTIVKGAGSALVAGDIAGAGHWIEVQYDQALDKWVLLNPAKGVSVTSPQIQPISASVAASALTISASALNLDFRSSTLASGVVTTVAGIPTALVVPSTATLGTGSGEQSRLVVLALNNAGTIELAVVNLAGGNDLTETGLISTTALSAAATSASVIYSNTARTLVAYRVIGYIESTQATAGTWATAPSTIQGVGGQALAAMSSLGYGQTQQTVTRNSGTAYYTTGRPVFYQCTTNSISSAAASQTISFNGGPAILLFTCNNTVANGSGSILIPAWCKYVITDTSITTKTTTEIR